MLDYNLPAYGRAVGPELAVPQERVRGLEAQVALLEQQLDLERQRNAGLIKTVEGGGGGARPQVAVLAVVID